MLRLADRWVWDHWLVDTGADYHVFYLQAPRFLGDPDLRHQYATVGHAVSTDLVAWRTLPDALLPGRSGAWDDRAIWTGSVARIGSHWVMAYTGTATWEQGLTQRIGLATSPDLVGWTRVGDGLAVEADPRWYRVGNVTRGEETPWRDPWLLRDPGGRGWHMLITASAREGALDTSGVVGHAWSSDLLHWEVRPPLSEPGEFGKLEVTQVSDVDGRLVLTFCTSPDMIGEARRARVGDEPAGTFVCAAGSPLGPFDVGGSRLATELYAGRLVRRRDGSWAVMGFVDIDADGGFGGYIPDPVPVGTLPAWLDGAGDVLR